MRARSYATGPFSLFAWAVLASCAAPGAPRSGPEGSAGGASGTSASGGAGPATDSGGGAGTPVGAGGAPSSAGAAAGGAAAGGGAAGAAHPNPPPPNEFCAGLGYEENVTVAGAQTDRFSWNDARCEPRTAAMARLPRGYVRQYTYTYDGDRVRTATGTGVNGHQGWGFPVNHGLRGLSGGGPLGTGHFQPIFAGAHHAVYEYRLENDGLVVTLQWLFASGKDHPLVAITYDLTGVSPGLKGDTRTPYGDIAWDGDENVERTVVSGIGWGDRYKFVTTKAPLTRNSTWDYTEPNLVPYVLEWADASDSEMGVVQSQTYLQKDAGGYWFYKNWGKTSANQERDEGQVGEMPASWNWPYQMNQYELCYPESESCVDQPTKSHRLSWGANYGAVGGVDASGKYPAYGDDRQLAGYPYQSYSVFMVLGQHSTGTVFAQVREIETVQKTTLTASVGSVPAELPGGVARSDLVALEPAGYDARYSAWNVAAAGNRAALTLDVAEGTLVNPLLVVSNWSGTELPALALDGKALVPDVDYLASLDSAGQKVWITLRAELSGAHALTIE